jgi:hypothetical protein
VNGLLTVAFLLAVEGSPRLDVRVLTARENSGTFVVVNLFNSSHDSVTDVRVGLKGTPPTNIGDLFPGQQRAVFVPFSGAVSSPVAVVSFSSRGVRMSVARVSPSAQTSSLPWSTLAPAIMTLVGTFAGAALAHTLSMKRERLTLERSSRSSRMAAAVPALNAFLADWSASVLPNVLETQYAILSRATALPGSIGIAYLQTMKALREDCDRPARQAAATRFAAQIQALLTDVTMWG